MVRYRRSPNSTPPVPKGRAGVVRDTPFEPNGIISVGIDPGSRYTACVIRDGDVVLHATTLVREGDQEPVPYARIICAILLEIVNDYKKKYPDLVIGVEGVTDPRGHVNGKASPLNPKDIVRTGVTAGALAMTFPDALIIKPSHNGSQDLSQYPDSIKGRRQKDLPGIFVGAKTRKHEQSAYDIAGKTVDMMKGEK
jgi:hypothetical protein